MKVKSLAFLALIVTGSTVMASLLSAQATQLDPVILGAVGSGSANDWPIYVAMAEGFFEKNGLAVTFVSAPASSSVQQQLAAGSINIGTSAITDPLHAIGNGAPITLLRIEVGKAPYYMYAKPNIYSIAQLKNKNVSIGGAREITHYYFDRMAAAEGLDPASCNLIYAGSTPARLAALLSGSVDATMLLPPFVFVAQAKGFRQLPVKPGFDAGLPFTGFAVNTNWGESHKPLVNSFLDAYGKGVAWLYDPAHKERAVEILLQKAKVTVTEGAKTYDIYVKENLFAHRATIAKEDIQDEIDFIKNDGSLTGSAEFSHFYKPALLGLTK